jgi:hypothetical protein
MQLGMGVHFRAASAGQIYVFPEAACQTSHAVTAEQE